MIDMCLEIDHARISNFLISLHIYLGLATTITEPNEDGNSSFKGYLTSFLKLFGK